MELIVSAKPIYLTGNSSPCPIRRCGRAMYRSSRDEAANIHRLDIGQWNSLERHTAPGFERNESLWIDMIMVAGADLLSKRSAHECYALHASTRPCASSL